jgi:hypothetical protein
MRPHSGERQIHHHFSGLQAPLDPGLGCDGGV